MRNNRYSRDTSTSRDRYHSETRRRSRSPRSSKPTRERSVREEEIEQPNYQPTGALDRDLLTVNGVLLKYSEPPEARKSTKQFRLYVFKGKEQVSLVPISDRTVYLIGKDDRVVDIRLDHPSISGQHAVLQYRQIIEQNEYGDDVKSIRLYILDLKSSNGTRVNKEPIPTSRYYELKTGDVIEFGFSSREYVLMDESIV